MATLDNREIRQARLLLAFEAATFIVAASIHFGALVDGYGHTRAGVAETVIACVLVAGLVSTFVPRVAAIAALGAQVFAALGVVVGLFTIAIGVGPRTLPDVTYHLCILAILVLGISTLLPRRGFACGRPA